MPPRIPYTMTSEAAERSPYSLPEKLCLFSLMPGTCGSLPPSSEKLTMAHTWSKSLVEDSTNIPMTASMNITQMLLKLTYLPFGDIAAAMPAPAPATKAVRLPAVAPATSTPAVPAATPNTPHKLVPVVHSPD